MKDRISTKILENGAIRYGIYDESGALIRYEYIKPEDEPTEAGTPLNKATLLSDTTEVAIWGNAANRTVDEALGRIKSDAVYAEYGTYVGAGTFGESNPNVLSCSFVPRTLFIVCVSTGGSIQLYGGNYLDMIILEAIPTGTYIQISKPSTLSAAQNLQFKRSVDKKTISWYGTAANWQMNADGYVYYYRFSE